MCCWSDSPCCWSDSPWHVRDNQHRPLPHQSVNIIHVKPNPARLQPAPATQIRYDEAAYSYVLRTLDYCSYTPAASGWAHALVTRNRFSAMVTQHNIEYIALPDQNKYSNHKCQDTPALGCRQQQVSQKKIGSRIGKVVFRARIQATTMPFIAAGRSTSYSKYNAQTRINEAPPYSAYDRPNLSVFHSSGVGGAVAAWPVAARTLSLK